MTKQELQTTISLMLMGVGWLLCGEVPVSAQEPATEQESASGVTQQEEPSPEASSDPASKGSEGKPKAADKTAESQETASEEKPLAEEPKVDDSTEEEPATAEPSPKRVIGATERIQELQSGFMFLARIDTGAKSCSLHVDELKIEDESEEMGDNVGKTIHFLLRNGKEKTFLAKAKIRSVVRIKNANGIERRYKVKMEFQCKNVKKRVFVTLNDRAAMKFPLLIGRSFLEKDFLVDVDINSTD